MKNLSFLFLLFFTFSLGAQNLSFQPKWKVGDRKKVQIEEKTTKYEEGALVEDTIQYNEAEIKVQKETDKAFILQVKYENQALKMVQKFYDKLGASESAKYKDIKLKFSVDKKTGKCTLLEWQKAQKIFLDGLDEMEALVASKSDSLAGFVSLAFMPLKMAFKDQTATEGYFGEFIAFILVPYESEWQKGQKITKEDTIDNPFKPGDKLTATHHYELISSQKKLHELRKDTDMDFEQFMVTLKTMMKSMMAGFGLDSVKVEEAMKEFDAMKMEMTENMVITYNEKSGWVEKSVKTGSFNMFDPRSKKESSGTVVITRTLTDFE